MILEIIIISFLIIITDIFFLRIPNILCTILFLFTVVFILSFGLYVNVLGALIGLIIFLFTYIFSLGKIGEGDIKIIPSLGLILGFPGILLLIFIASIMSIGFFMLNKKRKVQVLPFAPFLFISLLIILLYECCSF